MADLPRSDPSKFELIALHKSIGLTVLALSVLRLAWRLVNPGAAAARGTGPLAQIRRPRACMYLLYFLIVAIPLAGWLMVSVGSMGHPTPVFGLFGWPSVPILSDMPRSVAHPYHELFETIHVWLAWSDDRADPAPHRRRRFITSSCGATTCCCACCRARACGATHEAHSRRGGARLRGGARPAAAHWTVDAAKSKLGFSVVWSKEPFTGVFRDWKADIDFDPADLAHSHVAVTIETGSEVSDCPTATTG